MKKRLTALLLTFSMMFSMMSFAINASANTEIAQTTQNTTSEGHTIFDALDILKHLAKLHVLSPKRIAELDMNSDGVITIEDALAILLMLAGHDNLVEYMELYRMVNSLHDSDDWLKNMSGLRTGNIWFDADFAGGGDRAVAGIAPPTANSPVMTMPAGTQAVTVTTRATAAMTTAGAPAKTEPGFSDTNNQVEGVQESDIVKTDGKNIYAANTSDSNNLKVVVVETNNGSMKTLATIKNKDAYELNEMLLYNGKLIIVWGLATDIDKSTVSQSALDRMWWWNPKDYSVIVEVYDTKGNFNKPSATYTQDGQFQSARMIDNHIYLITNFFPNLPEQFGRRDIKHYIPGYMETDCVNKTILPGEAIVLPEKLDTVEYTVISGLDVNKKNMKVSATATLGSTQTIYASLDNIYIARQDGANWWWWRNDNSNTAHTIIEKFAISKGKVEHVANTKVKGTIRNQFHLDEHKGNLRVVTEVWAKAPVRSAAVMGTFTTLPIPESAGWWDGWQGQGLDKSKDWGLQGGSLHILDKDLKPMSEIHRIGFGEEIKSVRFMGDTAYVVTFPPPTALWLFDPLYSFDLSNPYAPKVLDELKIPGYSTYMHPWSDGLLLGMGVDADETTGIISGMKLSMFDTSDNENLSEKHVIVFGGGGNGNSNTNDIIFRPRSNLNSPVLTDHRAALVCSDKNIIGFPYSNFTNAGLESYYAVFAYDDKLGFIAVGEIKIDTALVSGWTWNTFSRGLFIGDFVYAIATGTIVSAKLDAKLTEVQRLSL